REVVHGFDAAPYPTASQRGPLPPSPTLRGTKGSTLPPTPLLRSGDPFPLSPTLRGTKGSTLPLTPLLRSGDPFPPRQPSGCQRVRRCPLPVTTGDVVPIGAAAHARSSPG